MFSLFGTWTLWDTIEALEYPLSPRGTYLRYTIRSSRRENGKHATLCNSSGSPFEYRFFWSLSHREVRKDDRR